MRWPWVRRLRLEASESRCQELEWDASASLRASEAWAAVLTMERDAARRERDEANLRADIADAAMREAIRRLDAALLEFAED